MITKGSSPRSMTGSKASRLRREGGGELARRAALGHQDGRTIGDAVELAAVRRVGDDQLGLAAAGRRDAALDRRRPERREQGLIDRAGAPRAENDRQQFRRARQQRGDDVALSDALRTQEIGEAR